METLNYMVKALKDSQSISPLQTKVTQMREVVLNNRMALNVLTVMLQNLDWILVEEPSGTWRFWRIGGLCDTSALRGDHSPKV